PSFGPNTRRRSTIQDLRSVVVVTQLSFSLVLATLLALAPGVLLLLNRELSISTAQYLFVLTLLAGVVAGARGFMDMRRLDFLLRALSEDSDIVDARDVSALGRQAGRACVQWLIPHLLLLVIFATPMRPALMDFTTGAALMMLCGAIAATIALGLYAALRNSLLQVIELVPAKVMTEVVVSEEHSSESRDRITRRLLFAVVTPMLFVAVGSALIANAHVRRADEHSREEIARVMARAVFDPKPATLEEVGLQDLYAKATELGFPTQVVESEHVYQVHPLEGGFLEITTPLDTGVAASAIVRFHGSTVQVLSTESLLLAVLAIVLSAALGLALGNALTRDLFHATQGVRLLGTRALLSKLASETRPARFRIVRQLQRAVEGAANRFGIFAQAQQDAIAARAAATRMRGQFFASVSHDLKSPLNSILGFTELVRMEQLSEGQAESLQVISDRGQELLSLIETILDAARIEVGQLSLMFDEEPFSELYAATLEKAIALSGRSDMQIYEEIEPDLPAMLVDRIRGARALATFIAYSVRATDAGKMWVRAERHGPHHVRIDVDVPALLHSAADLQQMLDPAGGLSKREHRGLALALQLANSVVKLHGGSVHVVDRRQKGAMFCITLPTASGVANAVRAPEPDHPISIAPQRIVSFRGGEREQGRGRDIERPPSERRHAPGEELGPDTERPLPYDPDARDTEPPTAPEGYPVPDTERPPPPDPNANAAEGATDLDLSDTGPHSLRFR
ncbi:MAG TPA: HAMP domain-containing sensor histidine kinase, partial [Polyangiaceae bacterium]|nr:HAMP domain-containing sensor histidine kinase [Polyangiaceae bacterium]